MELYETVNGMNSDDYIERFVAEYDQTKIRYENLKKFNNKLEAARQVRCSGFNIKYEAPKCNCPSEILREQQRVMGEYLHLMELRAEIEGIEL